MGAWSAAIFGDDVALDVRERYLELLAGGVEGPEATRRLLAEFEGELHDVDDGPVLWLALAATQWEYGRLEDAVRERAIREIDGGSALARWEGGPAGRRAALLTKLRAKLLSPPPKPKRPRRRPQVEVPSHKLAGPDGLTLATAFEIGTLGQVLIEISDGTSRGGGGVFAGTCSHQDIGLRWVDAGTLEISLPAGIQALKKDESTRFCGRTVSCVYRTR